MKKLSPKDIKNIDLLKIWYKNKYYRDSINLLITRKILKDGRVYDFTDYGYNLLKIMKELNLKK